MNTRSWGFARLSVVLVAGAALSGFTAATAAADPVPSTTQLTAGTTSPVFGSALTLQAQVTGAGVPTGTVTFRDGVTVVGSATLDASGAAQISISSLIVGAHTLTASYAGDTNNSPSVSAAAPVTVFQRSKTDILFYSQPKVPATTWTPTTPLVLVANVIKSTPNGTKRQPTGTVTFNVDGVLTTLPLTGLHHANLVLPNGLPLGTHHASAFYNGDGTFTRSGSASKAIKINRNLTTSVTDSPDPVPAGSTLTYTLHVTNNGLASAAGATASDTIPTGETLISATAAHGCTGAAPVSCSLGTLAVHASATVTIVVQVPSTATGTIADTATALPGLNNVATEATAVVASP